MSDIVMWDDVTPTLIPSDAQYIGYYVDGRYANGAQMAMLFPHAKLIGIAVREADNADVLDVETGDATNADVFYWLKRGQKPKTTRLPVIYTSVSNVNQLMLTMSANNFVHGKDFLLWSAHYGAGPHICGPTTCNQTRFACDATQYTDWANNRSLDESLCLPSFFAAPAPAPAYPAVQTGTVHSDTTGLSAKVRTTDGGKTWVYV